MRLSGWERRETVMPAAHGLALGRWEGKNLGTLSFPWGRGGML